MQRLRKFTIDSEAVIGIKSPFDYTYLKILRFNLLVINSWPGKEIGENLSKFRILITVGYLVLHAFFIIGGFMYMRSTALTFFELVNMYVIQFMCILIVSRIILISLSTNYKKVFAILLTKMHLFYFKDLSDYAMQTHIRVHLISHIFTLFITWQMICSVILFEVIPMYRNYAIGNYNGKSLQNSTYEHAFYYSFPFDITTTLPGYIFACVLNWFESYFMATWFCVLDLVLSLLAFNIWGHFKILIHDLKSFPLPAKKTNSCLYDHKQTITVEMYSDEELQAVCKKLKDCINYHRVIVEFTNRVSDTFGPMLLVYYIFHQVSLCLMLLECSQMTVEAIASYGPLTGIMFQQLIQLSVIFELIGTQSEKLKDAAYGIPWEYMDIKNKKIVAIFLMNLQEPIYVKALGIARVGVTSMATIIKTSLSYFAFLRTSSKGIKTPLDYDYLKILRFYLIVINSWPAKETGRKLSKNRIMIGIGYMILYLFYCIGGFLFMRSRTLSFFELGHMYTTQLMFMVTASRVILISLSSNYNDVLSSFLNEMHLFYNKHKSDYAMKTHKRVHLMSHIFTQFTTWQMISGLVLFNLTPMYDNFVMGNYKHLVLQNSTYEHSVYYAFPFDITTTLHGYIMACIFNWIESCLTATWFCMVDLLISLIAFHIWGHFKILIHDLASFPSPAVNNNKILNDDDVTLTAEMYTEEELEQVSKKLHECIIYHRLIAKFTSKVSDAFGPVLFVYFIYHQVSLCLMLLECSQMTVEALMRYGPVTIILFQQLIQMSVIFELIGTMSEKLTDAVYGVPWEKMDVKNRRTVLIFLINVHEPIYVKALGVTQVGVTSMAMILKTSFSYFAFLRTSSK